MLVDEAEEINSLTDCLIRSITSLFSFTCSQTVDLLLNQPSSYPICIPGLTLVVQQGDYTGIGNLFLLLNKQQLVNSFVDVAVGMHCKCSPKWVDRITCLLVVLVAKCIKSCPQASPDVGENCTLADLTLLEPCLRHCSTI